jgi:hypothetical protein
VADPTEESPLSEAPAAARDTLDMLRRALARHLAVTEDADPIQRAKRRRG